MNNKNRFIALFFALFLLSFCLISCETQLGTFDGKISFSLSESTISSIMSRAVSEAGSSNSDILTFKIDLLNSDDSMIDSKSETHSIPEWNTLSSIDMSFDNVLVGSYVYAVATVSTPQKVICRGESQKTKVRKNRDTELSITMDYVGGTNTYTITVTLNKPTAYNSLNQISGSLYYLPANSADVTTLKAYAVSAMNMGSSVMYIQDTDSLTAIVNRATKIKDINVGTVSETYLLDSEAELNRYIFAKVSYKDSNASSGISCLALPQDSVTLTPSGTSLSLTSYAFGTPYVLWSDASSKFSSYAGYTSADGSITATTRGSQVFDSINSSSSIADPISNSSDYLDAFCFGGKYFFTLRESGVLCVYKATDNGYTTLTSQTGASQFDLRTAYISKTNASYEYNYITINDIEYYDGFLYFSLIDGWLNDYEGKSSLVRIKAPEPSNESEWDPSTCEWALTTENIPMGNFAIKGDKIYYYGNNSINKSSYSVENGTITLTGSDSWTIDPSSLGLTPNDSFSIKDMQINGSTLYVIIYKHAYYAKISNGGILKFPVDAQTFEPTVWSQSIPAPKILGWYKTSEETVQPPLNSDKVYFYGPQKFIAKKPDELVIADDGAYFDGENHKLYFKERAVTVNLLTESLSAVDVNVTFTCTFNSCGYN
ncbi:MAG: hypothetical protein J5747_06030 [Spirochaetaceae bacterium]|nr:hypothetical protein [Spirochaetaceae bacterium]